MHDVLRDRVLRRLESLPDDKMYQVLDYIEFLESRYGDPDLKREASGLQRFAERLEDGLRRRTVTPSTIREAFQLLSAADRVLSGVSSAGRQLLDELNVDEDPDAGHSPPAGRGAASGEGPEPSGGSPGEGPGSRGGVGDAEGGEEGAS